MLCLKKKVHDLWGKGRFALRPVDKPDEKTLVLEFHWQKKMEWEGNVDLMNAPESSRGLDSYKIGGSSLSIPSGVKGQSKKIKSGDTITMTTPDPEKLPLPNWDLLEMHWYLQRIAAMSGAAEDDEGFYRDDDNVEIWVRNVPDGSAVDDSLFGDELSNDSQLR